MSDIYISEDLIKQANKSALLYARTQYNEKIAPFVKNSSARLEFAKESIDKIVVSAANQFNADVNYIRNNLYSVIKESGPYDMDYDDDDRGYYKQDQYLSDNGRVAYCSNPGCPTYGEPQNVVVTEIPATAIDPGDERVDPEECPECYSTWMWEAPDVDDDIQSLASVRLSESEDKRTLEKGLGVGGERVKEDLTNAGDAFNPFGDGKSGDQETRDKGLGISGEKGEEAVSEIEQISIKFDVSDVENKDATEGVGVKETPNQEVKPIEDSPIDVEKTTVDYHSEDGPILEKEIRGPSAGGPGKKHDLKEDTFKWTRVENSLIIKDSSCSCDGNCHCSVKKK